MLDVELGFAKGTDTAVADVVVTGPVQHARDAGAIGVAAPPRAGRSGESAGGVGVQL